MCAMCRPDEAGSRDCPETCSFEAGPSCRFGLRAECGERGFVKYWAFAESAVSACFLPDVEFADNAFPTQLGRYTAPSHSHSSSVSPLMRGFPF